MSIDTLGNKVAYQEVTTRKVENIENIAPAPSITHNNSTKVAYEGSANDSSNKKQNPEDANEKVKSAVEEANKKMKMMQTRCEFSYHDVTNRVSIKVIDKDTDEVVIEIPPEQSIEMVEKMWNLAGLVVDEKR